MKLEPKHLAPYLPYGLKMRIDNGDDILNGEIIKNYSISNEGHISYSFGTGGGHLDAHWFKPILRPLSDLTKEIEHNGEKFVPIKKLLERWKSCSWDDKTWKITNPIHGGVAVKCRQDSVISIHVYPVIYSYRNEWLVMEFLFENHFDVFGLTEQGLAIAK